MRKFVLLYQYSCAEGWIDRSQSNVFFPNKASVSDLSIVHSTQYLSGLINDDLDRQVMRRIGLPWSQGLMDRTFTAPNGTLLAARIALQEGMACHLAGGTHHAHFDFGSGFCLVNDLAYSAKALCEEGRVKSVLIFDCDVHQGDGTAAILEEDDRVFTCSVHCEKNFPFRKQTSNLDVGLDVGLKDDAYLTLVQSTLEDLLNSLNPDLVLYDAGVDVWEYDSLGHLNISWSGIYERDELVLRNCLQRSIPVATVIGGGYDHDLYRLAKRHGIIVSAAHHLYPQYID